MHKIFEIRCGRAISWEGSLESPACDGLEPDTRLLAASLRPRQSATRSAAILLIGQILRPRPPLQFPGPMEHERPSKATLKPRIVPK
jgi:hypothetical protein